jgi:hypothetical protein
MQFIGSQYSDDVRNRSRRVESRVIRWNVVFYGLLGCSGILRVESWGDLANGSHPRFCSSLQLGAGLLPLFFCVVT